MTQAQSVSEVIATRQASEAALMEYLRTVKFVDKKGKEVELGLKPDTSDDPEGDRE